MSDQAKKLARKALQRWETEGGATEEGAQVPKRKRPRDELAKSTVDLGTGETEDREPTAEEQGKDPAAVSLGSGAVSRAGRRGQRLSRPSSERKSPEQRHRHGGKRNSRY